MMMMNATRTAVARHFRPRLIDSKRYFASDYFATLGVPRSFAVTNDELKQSYRTLMADFHPDRHTLKSQEEQEIKAEEASKVTNAYAVLQNPHERAVHLLELLDKPLEETASQKLVGMEFLMEIMELREAIAAQEEQADLEVMKTNNEETFNSICEDLVAAFDGEDLDKALQLTAQLQYFNRIDETLRDKITNVK